MFQHYRQHIAEVKSTAIAKIGVALCNLVYDYTLHGDYVLYYVGAYALSIAGAEEWRRVLANDESELPAAFRPIKLNLESDEPVVELMQVVVADEALALEDEVGVDSDLSLDYDPSPKEAANVGLLKKRERSRRLINLRQQKEEAEDKAVFVFVCSCLCMHFQHMSLIFFFSLQAGVTGNDKFNLPRYRAN
jgi:hypothetical protein